MDGKEGEKKNKEEVKEVVQQKLSGYIKEGKELENVILSMKALISKDSEKIAKELGLHTLLVGK